MLGKQTNGSFVFRRTRVCQCICVLGRMRGSVALVPASKRVSIR